MKEFKSDGHLRLATREDLVPGVVLRMVYQGGGIATFSDSLVVKVLGEEVHLSRPTIFLQNGAVSTHIEMFSTTIHRLTEKYSCFRIVLQSTGLPANHSY